MSRKDDDGTEKVDYKKLLEETDDLVNRDEATYKDYDVNQLKEEKDHIKNLVLKMAQDPVLESVLEEDEGRYLERYEKVEDLYRIVKSLYKNQLEDDESLEFGDPYEQDKEECRDFLSETENLVSIEISEYNNYSPAELVGKQADLLKKMNVISDKYEYFAESEEDSSEDYSEEISGGLSGYLGEDIDAQLQERYMDFVHHYGEVIWLRADAAINNAKELNKDTSSKEIKRVVRQLKGRLSDISSFETQYKEMTELLSVSIPDEKITSVGDVSMSLKNINAQLDESLNKIWEPAYKEAQSVLSDRQTSWDKLIEENQDLEKLSIEELNTLEEKVDAGMENIENEIENVRGLILSSDQKYELRKNYKNGLGQFNQFKAKIVLARTMHYLPKEGQEISLEEAKTKLLALNDEENKMEDIENEVRNLGRVDREFDKELEKTYDTFQKAEDKLVEIIDKNVGIQNILDSANPINIAMKNFSEKEVRAIAGKTTAEKLLGTTDKLMKLLEGKENVDEKLMGKIADIKADLEAILVLEPVDVGDLLDPAKDLVKQLEASKPVGGFRVTGWINSVGSLPSAIEDFSKNEALDINQLKALDKDFVVKLASQMSLEDATKLHETLKEEKNIISMLNTVEDTNIREQKSALSRELRSLNSELIDYLSTRGFVEEVVSEMAKPEIKSFEEPGLKGFEEEVLGNELAEQVESSEKEKQDDAINKDEPVSADMQLEKLLQDFEKLEEGTRDVDKKLEEVQSDKATKENMMGYNVKELDEMIEDFENRLNEEKNSIKEQWDASKKWVSKDDFEMIKNLENSLKTAREVLDEKQGKVTEEKADKAQQQSSGIKIGKRWVAKASDEVGGVKEEANEKTKEADKPSDLDLSG